MPFCENCGTKLGAGAKFCANCGTKVNAAPAADDQAAGADRGGTVTTRAGGATCEVCGGSGECVFKPGHLGCDGTGTCRVCNGQGKITGCFHCSKTGVCQLCNGTGKCAECNGRGKI